ncbi:MAG TPA: (2Fe-2S)-binding protein [Thermoanaerobaculia bacterium]|nr:(2Fe-2S)-binding protein [Thermoanaerobaculia bacterium]
MDSCCSTDGRTTPEARAAAERCPSCGSKGLSVDPVTLKALLTSKAFRRGVPPAPRFCATASCPVVYFDNGVPITFAEHELTTPVHAKHPENEEVPVCYCFGYTPRDIREEIIRTGSSGISKTVKAEVAAGHCACEVRNPKGACCLGDIANSEKRIQSDLAVTSTQRERT